jgi:hypothetical protein
VSGLKRGDQDWECEHPSNFYGVHEAHGHFEIFARTYQITYHDADMTATFVCLGSLASDLTCQRHVRLDRDLGHSGGTGEEFRAGIQRSIDKGWMVRHESGTYVKFTPTGAELFA